MGGKIEKRITLVQDVGVLTLSLVWYLEVKSESEIEWFFQTIDEGYRHAHQFDYVWNRQIGNIETENTTFS